MIIVDPESKGNLDCLVPVSRIFLSDQRFSCCQIGVFLSGPEEVYFQLRAFFSKIGVFLSGPKEVYFQCRAFFSQIGLFLGDPTGLFAAFGRHISYAGQSQSLQ